MDRFDARKRSEIMSGIRAKDTKPEQRVRKLLFAQGFRYRLNDRRLPGVPDIVLKKYGAVVFVHGCFWHAHEGCRRSSVPATREAFWREKLERNKRRDAEVREALLAAGWRVLTVWECACRKRLAEALAEEAAAFLRDPARICEEIDGRTLSEKMTGQK